MDSFDEGSPDDTGREKGRENAKVGRGRRDRLAERSERRNERTNERTVEPWSCYGAGERRKRRPVRLISAAGADKAFVHSPTTADRPLGARESGIHVLAEEREGG